MTQSGLERKFRGSTRRSGRSYSVDEFKYEWSTLRESLKVRRKELHWSIPESQDSNGATGYGFPLNKQAATYFLRARRRANPNVEYWLEDVDVPLPDERFSVRWEKGKRKGTLPIRLSAEAVYYYIILDSHFDQDTVYTIEELDRRE